MPIRQFNGEPFRKHAVRATLLGITIVLIGGFALAFAVSPDPRGFGTHHQFGLPPCTFRLLFGWPCPGCGMTTCFAHFVRGQFVEAARANPAGIVLATVCAAMIPWSLWSIYLGQLWKVSNPTLTTGVLAIGLSTLTMLIWLARIAGSLP